ncbi:unnamed protein product [Anisakis simplex]|uniref:glucuronosyltransferase n=1 Tax=Anisakis simplex TaxID=6269 RepID=A0A3P6SX01_ANISI|nr:unnamed protein product [Anisakis simplex]
MHRYGAHVLTSKFRELADPNFPNVREIAAESALCFVSSDEFLDVARPILHKTIYIGGFGVPNEAQPLDEPYRSMMRKGKKGVILVSLGTVVPSSKLTDQMREDFFKLFKHFSDYHFIWKIDEQDEKARKLAAGLKNIDLVRWIPQKDMLG